MVKMKQLCLELWIENKQFPILFLLKIMIVLIALFSDILIEASCGFVIVFFAGGMIMVMVFFNPQIDYLLPRTDEERRKAIIGKSALTAGFYTAAGTIGYVLIICFYKQYQWDAELLFFMIMFSIYVFTNNFCCSVSMWQRKNMDASNVSFRQELIDMGAFEWLKIAAVIFAGISTVSFCFYKFAKWESLLFLGRGKWRITALIMMSITALLLCLAAWRDAKKIVIRDYCE